MVVELERPPAVDTAARNRLLRRLPGMRQPPWLHQEVARRMAQRLVVMRQPPAQWLDWWGGWGGSEAAVAAIWPQAQRQLVEPTPQLLARAQAGQKAPWWALQRRVMPGLPALLEPAVPEGRAQMLWANLMLQTAPDPAQVLLRWHRALADDGLLMFSTYGPDTLKTLRAAYAASGWPAPAQDFIDMHDLGDLLVASGFADPVMDQELLQLNWSSPEACLAELQGLGGNLAPQRHPGLRTPGWRRALCQALQQHCSVQGRITLGFELVYGHAFKGKARRAAGAAVPVSLSALHDRVSRR